MDVIQILHHCLEQPISDLHLICNQAPIIRIHGKLNSMAKPIISKEALMHFMDSILNKQQLVQFNQEKQLDFAFSIPNLSRFRANAFASNHELSIALRVIPNTILNLQQLHLPNVLLRLGEFTHGLVLITGATGSGKSSTLAALIQNINQTQQRHIITLEDPIEFIHQNNKCLIQQREINTHVVSFQGGLKAALRQDPDIILIGELRDLETIRLALRAAETGHLVFATLHTESAPQTINRIIEVFPASEQNLVRSMLANTLKAVVSQELLPKLSAGRIAACEVMLPNTAISNLIKENKIEQIRSSIQMGVRDGMQTMEQHKQQLIKENLLDTN